MGTDPGATPNDEDVLLTYGARYVTGDVSSIGDQPFRLVDTVAGAGLFTINSDPQVTNVDPLTGLAAPIGTDVGFGSPARRFIHTGVWNGDFSIPPTTPGAAISDDNVLPYWIWAPGIVDHRLVSVADATFGSGRKVTFTGTTASGTSYLYQLAPVPASQGQQYRVLPSMFLSAVSNAQVKFAFQFYANDATTAIGSIVTSGNLGVGESKFDGGLVPTSAAYVLLRVALATNGSADPSATIGEVRCAFLPAEATIGLKAITGSATADTSEAQIVGVTILPNTFTIASTYRIKAWGQATSSAANACTFRIRIGPTTLTGVIPASVAPVATTTASGNGFEVEAVITFTTTTTVLGGISVRGTGPGTQQPFSDASRVGTTAAAVTIDRTVSNILELTAVTAAATTSLVFYVATIECLMAS